MGVDLIPQRSEATTALLPARVKPVTTPAHPNQISFVDQPNTAGQVRLKLRKNLATVIAEGPNNPQPTIGQVIEVAVPTVPAPVDDEVIVQQLPVIFNEARNLSRSSKWRRDKADELDRQRAERGEPPLKRKKKYKEHYSCKKCNQPKNKETGHSQFRGNWWCPTDGVALDDWKSGLVKK